MLSNPGTVVVGEPAAAHIASVADGQSLHATSNMPRELDLQCHITRRPCCCADALRDGDLEREGNSLMQPIERASYDLG